ncbi:glutathione S-transferase N-terminal domain-containing protein [Solibacillus sp. MA9]|uniref:Glutathione S-transferase N-terminal domain-containing protein n=1 Tax=Solibacillus palustris TaxID=2908203 RepID=A0ABS9UC88_9BACL|nr:glutaredoxin domain-containing protein [Solibacillus sp. MA9]MCH7321966.1 glutathione S-transferase N-terminal domain-containing protein [Solibacillus sp. MA9]
MKLYTKTICPKCLWVKSELEAANLQVEVINIDHDENAKQTVVDAGFLAVPVLEVNGEWFAEPSSIMDRIAELSA